VREERLPLREGVGTELSEHLEADHAEQHRPEQDGPADHGRVDLDPEAVAYSRQVGPERSRDRHGRRPVDDVPDTDPLGDEGDKGADHPRPRFRRPLARRLVPRYGTAVEQRIPRGLPDRPLAHGDADREDLGVPGGPGQLGEPRVDDVAELGVRVDDEQRQQLVAARDVSVHRRRHHPEITGDRAERQRGGTVLRQMPPPDLQHPPGHVVAAARAGSFGHSRSLAQIESSALDFRGRRGAYSNTCESSALLFRIEEIDMTQPAAPTRYIQTTRGDVVFMKVVRWLTEHGVSLLGSRVLTVRGRKTGNPQSVPVNLLQLDGDRFLVAPRGNTQWVRNVRAAGEAELRVGRRIETVRLVEVPADQRVPVLRVYLKRWGWEVGRFVEGLTAHSTDAELAAAAPGMPVFRLEAIATTTAAA
jgi:deazaflavin-dependent oxidoreductase (nitroreductase family)